VTNLVKILVTYVASYNDLIQGCECLAAAQDIMLYNHESLGTGEWPEKWSNIKALGHICLIINGWTERE
jgi:hypothetical protein